MFSEILVVDFGPDGTCVHKWHAFLEKHAQVVGMLLKIQIVVMHVQEENTNYQFFHILKKKLKTHHS